ncbi:hypothetical protein NW762_002905 [Fusarium torreyae]|uniref:AAA+ ATPase domain-containing protein n=1 Tax=Fusarium torreyae TaxID=1237075 RepID=A0A9W8VMI0_9HYPO|nr:hypothetical protein NW762_002905 [Fusarium torreyae]
MDPDILNRHSRPHPFPIFPQAPRTSRAYSFDAEENEYGYTSPSDPPGNSVEVGMTSEIKNLYRKSCREPWQEWTSEEIGVDSKSSHSSAKFALIVRREKRHGDTDESTLALHSITVQSPLIKKLLGPVFEGYKGINTNLKKLEFRAPFREFFYRWKDFVKADPSNNEELDDECSHFKLLADILSAEIQPHIEQTKDLLKNDVISFDYLWALFEPDAEVYAKADGRDRLFILNSGSYQKLQNGSVAYVLSVSYVDTDGDGFGYGNTDLIIWPFENVKPVLELEALPSHLLPDIADLRNQLAERGRVFESLKGVHHRSYSGAYTIANVAPGAPTQRHVTDERIVIDGRSFSKYLSTPVVPLGPLEEPKMTRQLNGDPAVDDIDLVYPPPPSVPMPIPPQMARISGRRRRQAPVNYHEPRRGPPNEKLSEEHYPLCTHLVKGFCLKSKKWGYFDVDLVKDVAWSSAAFDQLVLPHDYKRIIRAFVDAQISGLDDFDDVIKGKGRGIIMLLSGDPGTGKTLTAESVAETMQKPLYGMSAGELGDDAHEVEENFDRVLDLSTKWGAVLLLDECDVFLEHRSASDIKRNKLVSIFLRLLEYYQGVMFLTTNRVSTFDPAFESRIHLTIHYPKLDLSSRFHIWKTFVTLGSDNSGLSEADLEELAREELNGRQIKNVVKTARLLAANEGTGLAMSHVNTVLRIKRG